LEMAIINSGPLHSKRRTSVERRINAQNLLQGID
jgi:hypothetical protein